MFVAVDRQAQFVAEPLGQCVSVFDGFFHRNVGDGNERADIHHAEARMLAVMFAHVDQLGRNPRAAHGRFDDRLWLADQCDDGAVGGLAGIDVEQINAVNRFDRVGDLFDDGEVVALAEVWYAFDELVGHYWFQEELSVVSHP